MSTPPDALSIAGATSSTPVTVTSQEVTSTFKDPVMEAMAFTPISSLVLDTTSEPTLSSKFVVTDVRTLSDIPSKLGFAPPFMSKAYLVRAAVFVCLFSFVCSG